MRLCEYRGGWALEGTENLKVLEAGEAADIVAVEGSTLPMYKVKFPELTAEEQVLLAMVRERAADEVKIDPSKIPPDQRWSVFAREVERVIERFSKKVPPETLRRIAEVVADEFVGYGPFNPMSRMKSLRISW